MASLIERRTTLLYCMDQALVLEADAGSKARADASVILERRGGRNAPLVNDYKSDPLSLLRDLRGVEKQAMELATSLHVGDVLVVQFPFRGHRVPLCRKLCERARSCGATTIALVHDLSSLVANHGILPDKVSLVDSYRLDYRSLSYFDWVICHNGRMGDYLVRAGIDESKLVTLDLFDYLVGPGFCAETDASSRNVISYAGNLNYNRSGFIYELAEFIQNKPYNLELFGSGYEADRGGASYRGVCEPDELPGKLTGAYGLVWNGTSIDACEGNDGQYLRFNNPHKLSLYYASGLIPIVWSESAVSEFVNKTKSGIVVDSLRSLPVALEAVDYAEYYELRSNVEIIMKRVREGYYLNAAIDKCLARA